MICVHSQSDAVLSDKDWYVWFDAPLKILLTARFFAAFLVHISDCDETFNYWEPVNPLLFNDYTTYNRYGHDLRFFLNCGYGYSEKDN